MLLVRRARGRCRGCAQAAYAKSRSIRERTGPRVDAQALLCATKRERRGTLYGGAATATIKSYGQRHDRSGEQ